MQRLPTPADTSFLGISPLYTPLPELVRRKLVERGELRRYGSGEVIFNPGEFSEEAFVIVSGLVEICRADEETGRPKVVAYLGEGDSVGEMVLFTGSYRSSLARVPEEAEVFVLPRAAMIETCREEPDLALYFCRLFASRLESWVKKGRRQDFQKQLQGNLRYFDLSTILQTLGDTAASGTLIIRSDTGEVYAELDFAEGKLRFARLGHLRGEHAFYQLFQPPPQGTFLFQGGVHLEDDSGPAVEGSIMGLLMEAMRLQDELQLTGEKFGDSYRIWLPNGPELNWAEDDTILPAFDVWSYLHRAVPLGQMLAELPYSRATILGVLDILQQTGQLR